MNHVKVLFFASVRDKTGTARLELDLEPGATVRQVKENVVGRFPAAGEVMEYCLAAVNHEYSADDAEIPAGAEIAFFPPVSGGSF